MGNDNLGKKGASILLVVFFLKLMAGVSIRLSNSVTDAGSYLPLLSIVGIQILVILLPALLFARMLRTDTGGTVRDILKWKPIGGKVILLCILIGCSVQAASILANAPFAYLINHLFGGLPPQPMDSFSLMEGLFLRILVAAALPAICEELLFRGVIMTTQKFYGFGAVLISAVYFAIMHNDISSFFGVLLLGIVLGLVTVLTGSVFAAIIVHFCSNAFAFILQELTSSFNGMISVDLFYLLVALLSLPLLVYGIRSLPPHKFEKIRLKEGFWNIPFMLILFSYIVNQTVSLFSLMEQK